MANITSKEQNRKNLEEANQLLMALTLEVQTQLNDSTDKNWADAGSSVHLVEILQEAKQFYLGDK